MVKSRAEIADGAVLLDELRGLRDEVLRQGERLAEVERLVAMAPPVGGGSESGRPTVFTSARTEGGLEAGGDAPGGTVYLVKPGDRLSRIASRFGVSEADLVEANGLASPDRIFVGQSLVIPGSEPATAPEPATGPEVIAEPSYGFSGREGTSPSPATTSAPSSGVREHVVANGETLFGIARLYGVSERAIQTQNGIANPQQIWAGQVLRIPVTYSSKGTGSAKNPVTSGKNPVTSGKNPVTSGKNPVTRSPKQPVAGEKGGGGDKGGGHTVVRGESLTSIARANGVTVAALQRANGIDDPDRIRIGQRLIIPSGGGGARTVTTPAPTPATNASTNVAVAAAENSPSPTAGSARARGRGFEPNGPDAASTPWGEDEFMAYWVVPGDSVESLSAVFNTSAERLREINGIAPGHQFETGSQILVPAEGVFSS